MSQKIQSPTNNNITSKTSKKSLELLLPPKISKKKTLVLDLDETLVHSQFGAFNIPSDVIINIEIENELHDIHVLVRPGVKEFLEKMSKKFEIVIFTASISKYAGPLLDILDKDKFCSFRLFREHCTLLNSSFVKDLKKLGRDLKDVIIVDNSPMAYLLNSDNGLPILTWFDDKNDKELFKIIPILDFLSLVPDVRDYIHKIVINNEISYDIAKKVIKEFNDKYRKTKDEKETKVLDRKVNNSSIEENIEISDGSDNNLAVINQDKNKQQININIINNNITNYIYDNKQSSKDENISDNIMTNEIQNKRNKHNFNPNSIIASVNKPNTAQTLSSLTPFIKEKKNKNSNSAKNINSKNGQNMNNYIHKKSESTGIGYKQKAKKNNYEEFLNINNKNIKNNNNNSLRNNTNYNYSSKSQNRKETKIKSNMNNNGDSNAKSAKMINNIKKQLYLNNNNNKNILVNKKHFMKNNDEKNQIKIINDGNLTSVHNNQKIMLNINNTEKTHRNHNKKNKTNTANNLLHSVDFANNEIAMYYHNDNFPFSKNGNFIHNGGYTSKNRNINKFLKKNNINNNKKSSSIDNEMNKNFQEKNKFNDIKLNNEFKYSKNKNKDKRIAINYTLQEEQKQQNPKKEKMQTLNNNNLLKEHTKSNRAVNIK